MFSKHFSSGYIASLLQAKQPAAAEIKELLRRESFDITHLSRLVLGAREESARRAIIETAVQVRLERWHGKVFLMPPLYVSSGDAAYGGCLDYCMYCPWRNGNVPSDQLIHLTADEVCAESAYLLHLGYGDIELVAATDPKLLKAQGAAECVAAAKKAGARNVGINFFPLRRSEDYKVLVASGCTFVVVWQETYAEGIYRQLHPRGPKANFPYRLDAHDRVLQGGVKTVGVAFLGGLADWHFDALATLTHAQYLRQEYGANIIFGMPRWKNGSGTPMRVSPSFYGDGTYELVGALYSLAMPDALPWFSTREHFDLSLECARGGGCVFTLDCSTEVGGYTRQGGSAQFPVYTRGFNEGVAWLRQHDLQPQIHLPW